MSDILKKTFADIAVGYSHGNILGRACYIRHLSYSNQIDYERKKDMFYEQAKSSGLLTEKEKLDQLIKNNEWNSSKDKQISDSKIVLEGLINTKAKAKHPSMIAGLNKQIKEEEEKIEKIESEKRVLLGLTCELFSEKEINDYYIYTNIFSNKEMTDVLFKEEEFEYFSNSEISEICNDYSKNLESCSEINIKKLAMTPLFQKYFSLTGENISQFFGKPICNLTFYQIELLKYGGYFRNIFINNDVKNWPKHVFDDPNVLIDYAETVARGKQDAQKQGAYDEDTVVVGANKEDAKALGLKTKNNIAKEIVQKGGNVLDYFTKNSKGAE